MNTITLIRTATGWNAHYTGPAASEIEMLFGTATIPTAYTAQASAETVRLEIAHRNPGYTVEVW